MVMLSLTADHEVVNEENEFRLEHRSAFGAQDLYFFWDSQSYPTKNTTAQDMMTYLQKFMPPVRN